MTPFPRPDGPLAASLGFLLELAAFTAAATLVVVGGGLLVGETLSVAESVTGSSTAASLLALLVFVLYVGVPASLLVARTGSEDDGATARSDGE